MASVGIKSFYRQQKKQKGGAAAGKKRSAKAAFAGSDLVPAVSPRLGAGGEAAAAEEEEEEEEMLRRFDMEMRYGPCVGMTRMERWARAAAMGLCPPAEVEAVLLRVREEGRSGGLNECIWEGRV